MKANYNTMESTIEGNKLIAQFMGWGKYEDRCFNTPYDDADYCNGEPTSICDDSRLKFHSSWDWLMPVVDKIDSLLGYSIEIYSLGANNKRMAIYSGGVIVVQSRLAESTIEAVYNCVIDFIKWYNGRTK